MRVRNFQEHGRLTVSQRMRLREVRPRSGPGHFLKKAGLLLLGQRNTAELV